MVNMIMLVITVNLFFSDVSDETYNSCESNEFGYSAGFGFGDFCILVTMVILMNMLFLAILVNMATLVNLFILLLHFDFG